jgi:hypothetical protein
MKVTDKAGCEVRPINRRVEWSSAKPRARARPTRKRSRVQGCRVRWRAAAEWVSMLTHTPASSVGVGIRPAEAGDVETRTRGAAAGRERRRGGGPAREASSTELRSPGMRETRKSME